MFLTWYKISLLGVLDLITVASISDSCQLAKLNPFWTDGDGGFQKILRYLYMYSDIVHICAVKVLVKAGS